MKRNMTRIRRWLDRLSSACENERWDSALVEADCLSAEVRQAREKIWTAAQNHRIEKRRMIGRHQLFVVVRTAGAALLIVFAASLPSAIEADKLWDVVSTKTVYVKEDRLSWVTPEEEELLLVLRAEMSKSSLAAAGAAAKVQPAAAKSRLVPGTDAVTNAKSAVTDNKGTNDVSNEDLLALVQIGEKALRENAPAIKIIN